MNSAHQKQHRVRARYQLQVSDYVSDPGSYHSRREGDSFLWNALYPAFIGAAATNGILVVNLDGTQSPYSPYFLDSSFGQLTRRVGTHAVSQTTLVESFDYPELSAKIFREYVKDYWRCPCCGAGETEPGFPRTSETLHGGLGDSASVAYSCHVSSNVCKGLVCVCGQEGSLHGSHADPCLSAICHHCQWEGRLPSWMNDAWDAGWRPSVRT